MDDSGGSGQMRPIPLGTELQEIIAGLNERADFEAAIRGHALIEGTFGSLIQTYFRRSRDIDFETNEARQESIKKARTDFEERGARWGFTRKITVAHDLGIISPKLEHNLSVINKIRNQGFAHSIRPVTFQATRPIDIPRECEMLTLHDAYNDTLEAATGIKMSETYRVSSEDHQIFLADEFGAVGAYVLFNDEELLTPRGRYLVAVRLAWIILEAQTLILQHRKS